MSTYTYITDTELIAGYPRANDYTSAQRSDALDKSYGLVNAYLNNTLIVPPITPWDGVNTYVESPQILKHCQLRLAQYWLEFLNVGWSRELEDFYQATIEILRGISQNELSLPGQISDRIVGWNIADIYCSGLAGGFYLDPYNTPPSYDTTLELRIDSTGTKYINSGVVFDTYQLDRSEVYLNNTTATYLYQTITDSLGNTVSFRWNGQWTFGDYVKIIGVPMSRINTAPEPGQVLRQRNLVY